MDNYLPGRFSFNSQPLAISALILRHIIGFSIDGDRPRRTTYEPSQISILLRGRDSSTLRPTVIDGSSRKKENLAIDLTCPQNERLSTFWILLRLSVLDGADELIGFHMKSLNCRQTTKDAFSRQDPPNRHEREQIKFANSIKVTLIAANFIAMSDDAGDFSFFANDEDSVEKEVGVNFDASLSIEVSSSLEAKSSQEWKPSSPEDNSASRSSSWLKNERSSKSQSFSSDTIPLGFASVDKIGAVAATCELIARDFRSASANRTLAFVCIFSFFYPT